MDVGSRPLLRIAGKPPVIERMRRPAPKPEPGRPIPPKDGYDRPKDGYDKPKSGYDKPPNDGGGAKRGYDRGNRYDGPGAGYDGPDRPKQ